MYTLVEHHHNQDLEEFHQTKEILLALFVASLSNQPSVASDLFPILRVLSFPECHVNGLTHWKPFESGFFHLE